MPVPNPRCAICGKKCSFKYPHQKTCGKEKCRNALHAQNERKRRQRHKNDPVYKENKRQHQCTYINKLKESPDRFEQRREQRKLYARIWYRRNKDKPEYRKRIREYWHKRMEKLKKDPIALDGRRAIQRRSRDRRKHLPGFKAKEVEKNRRYLKRIYEKQLMLSLGAIAVQLESML